MKMKKLMLCGIAALTLCMATACGSDKDTNGNENKTEQDAADENNKDDNNRNADDDNDNAGSDTNDNGNKNNDDTQNNDDGSVVDDIGDGVEDLGDDVDDALDDATEGTTEAGPEDLPDEDAENTHTNNNSVTEGTDNADK